MDEYTIHHTDTIITGCNLCYSSYPTLSVFSFQNSGCLKFDNSNLILLVFYHIIPYSVKSLLSVVPLKMLLLSYTVNKLKIRCKQRQQLWSQALTLFLFEHSVKFVGKICKHISNVVQYIRRFATTGMMGYSMALHTVIGITTCIFLCASSSLFYRTSVFICKRQVSLILYWNLT